MFGFNVIVAVTGERWKIANTDEPGMPWAPFPEDMKRFQTITTAGCDGIRSDSIILMGRKTADTFKKPLRNRTNVVLTHQKEYRKDEGFITVNSFADFIVYFAEVYRNVSNKLLSISGGIMSNEQIRKNILPDVFVIGGARVLKECAKFPQFIKTVYITYIDDVSDTDDLKSIYVPEEFVELINKYTSKDVDTNDRSPGIVNYGNGTSYTCIPFSSIGIDQFTGSFIEYQFIAQINNDEFEPHYMDHMYALTAESPRETRNGMVRSIFDKTLRIDLREGFPAMTTKRLFWKGVVEELLFFLQGKTQTKELSAKGVRIWDGNTSKEFLEKRGLPYEEGDMGPMYGFIWRNAGGTQADPSAPVIEHTGHDQLKMVLNMLISDPTSRRIMMTTYDASIAEQGVLYPCHGIVTQFYVNMDNKENYRLDCKMYQRSADWFLGVPFNIASYALLIHLMVEHVNFELHRHDLDLPNYIPGILTMDFGDTHLYETHLGAAFTQLGRVNHTLPKLKLNDIPHVNLLNSHFYEGVTHKNFELVNYVHEKSIKAKMVP